MFSHCFRNIIDFWIAKRRGRDERGENWLAARALVFVLDNVYFCGVKTLKELQIHKLTITKKQKKQKRAKPSQPRPLQSRIFPPLVVSDEKPQEIRYAHFFILRQIFQFYAKIGSCADVQIHGLFPVGGFAPRVFAATAAGGFFLGNFFFVHCCLFEAAKIRFFDYVLTFSTKKDKNIFDYVLTVSIIFVYLCIVKGLRHWY